MDAAAIPPKTIRADSDRRLNQPNRTGHAIRIMNDRHKTLAGLTQRAVLLSGACYLAACGGSSGGSSSTAPVAPGATAPSGPAGPASFGFAPIEPSALQEIVPLGAMNPWGHTLPTDHIYFSHHFNTGSFPPVTISAPASGTVESVLDRGNGDAKISIRITDQVAYAIDHINLKAGFVRGVPVQGGAEMGTSTSGVFDLGVTNMDRPLAFVNPVRYSRDTLYADSPLKYFEEPLRSQFYAKVKRTGGDRDGRIDYDVAATLSGNWFADDLPPERSSIGGDMNVGTRQLSFARDMNFPERLRVSLGGLGMTGLWGVPPAAPDFTTVTPSSGLVVYRLLELGEPGGPAGTRQLGLLLVQLLDAERLRVEAVSNQVATTATFGPDARIYLR
jgi:hypothetical protein